MTPVPRSILTVQCKMVAADELVMCSRPLQLVPFEGREKTHE
jgi:hypothetical protein